VSESLPPPDRVRIRATKVERADVVIVDGGSRIVRIHPLSGYHPRAWDEWRYYGPTKSRFDHHAPPPHNQERAIAYVVHGEKAFIGAIAEYFQEDAGAGIGPINLRLGSPNASVFNLESPLRLLDLDGGWVTRAGGNQAIKTGSRSVAREWAREIYEHHGSEISGLSFSSSVWGPGRCLALWESAKVALPSAPLASRPLADPSMRRALEAAAADLGTYVLP